MPGSFTWDAIVRIGTIKPYPRALVITVYHDAEHLNGTERRSPRPEWNTIVCFKPGLKDRILRHLAPGDLVHFEGFVRTGTFTDDADTTRRTVDLVIKTFDLLNKHIDGPAK